MAKDSIKRTKHQPTDWEWIFTNRDTLLISNIYKEHKKVEPREPNNPIKKWGTGLNKEFSHEELQMTEKHLKKCSTLHIQRNYVWKKQINNYHNIIREMQIKTTLRFHLTPVRMAEVKNSGDSRCWQGYWRKRNTPLLLVGL